MPSGELVSIETDLDLAKELVKEELAASTREGYGRDFRQFSRWCAARNVMSRRLAVTPRGRVRYQYAAVGASASEAANDTRHTDMNVLFGYIRTVNLISDYPTATDSLPLISSASMQAIETLRTDRACAARLPMNDQRHLHRGRRDFGHTT